MNHLGNICNINGAEVEPVDVVIGGSPCQDLSVAGKRAGLDGERSGLFMEQIRIIKEMRNADKLRHTNAVSTDCGEGGTATIESGITQHGLCGANQPNRPRYMVWENVPGAFSSNKGEDFRVVLEETAKIADETAVIPQPAKGKWANAGAVMGDGWSIAWRVFDAQFWGVPQRRRRIALVADFGGQSAPEILFERKGGNGNLAQSGAEGEGAAGDVESGVGKAEPVVFDGANVTSKYNVQNPKPGDPCFTLSTDSRNYVVPTYCLQGNGIDRADTAGCNGKGWTEDVSYTLNTVDKHAVYSFDSLSSNSMKSSNPHSGCRQVEVAKCIDTTNPDPSKNQGGVAVVELVLFEPRSQDGVHRLHEDGVCPTFNTSQGRQRQPCVATYAYQRTDELKESQVSSTQSARQYKSPTDLVAAVDCRNLNETGETFGTLQAKPNGGQSLNYSGAVRSAQSVRRLTPIECERLQGFPDGWTDIPPQAEVTAEDLSFWREVWDEWQAMEGKKPKTDKQIIKWLQSEPADSARYKALGNSIALPPWRFVLSRIHSQGARTMASLFDGIGGFPKVWQELGGQMLWASEVEPFPILVTKYHFKEEHNGK